MRPNTETIGHYPPLRANAARQGLLDKGWVLAILDDNSRPLRALVPAPGYSRMGKRLITWTKANAENGTPIPPESKRMARMVFLTSRANAFLSIPMLFFMGAASHYHMFGR
jgi:hypothetical protein